jgi:hypothetical protein
VTLAAGQDEDEWLAPTLGADVHPGREAAARPPECLMTLTTDGSRRVLVRPDDRPVGVVRVPVEVAVAVGRALEDLQYPGPEPGSRPAAEPVSRGGP